MQVFIRKLNSAEYEEEQPRVSEFAIELERIQQQENELLEVAQTHNAIYSPVTGNYYFLTQSTNNWHGAQLEAIAAGGNLVTINNQEEQEWLNGQFPFDYWIGLTDEEQEGNWQWVSGESITFTNWLPGQPDNWGNEDYVHTWHGGGRWNDNTSSGQYYRGVVELNLQQLQEERETIYVLQKNYEEEKIADLQFLRVELAHLALTAEQEPDKVQSYLAAYQESDKTESAVTALRNEYFPELTEAAALNTLQTQINQEVDNNQQQLEQLKASINEKQANAGAALSQADWYEEQAAIHWELSRKQGPIWTEQRVTWKRGKSGKRKRHEETVSHVDHHWIIWDTYTKQAANLRDYAQDLLNDVETETAEKDTTQEILDQWLAASSSADAADLAYSDLVNQLQALEAERELTGEQELQLDTLKELLPTLLQQLTQAQEQVEAAKAKVALEWEELESSEEAYEDSLGDVLTRKAELETQSQQLLLQIASGEEWARQESVELETEIAQITATRQELEGEIADIEAQLEGATETDILQSQIAQLQKSVDLLTHKETILTSHNANLAQKQTLLIAQSEVIQKEEELLKAYLTNPDGDYSYLEAQLEAARALLAEVEELAKQAEASSAALSGSFRDLETSLTLQNDQFLATIKEKQEALQNLLSATEKQVNYNLAREQTLHELNTLEAQLLQRLEEATAAGSQEAELLLEAASANNFATAAEIYHRDYADLATDTGSSCAGGIARPEDRILADRYRNESIRYRHLESQALAQAQQFTAIKELAEAQINLV